MIGDAGRGASVDATAAGSTGLGRIAAGDLGAEARSGTGVVAGEHHLDRTGRHRRVLDDGQVAQLLRRPPARQGRRSWRPGSGCCATRSASLLPTLPCDETLAGQHLRHRGGQPVDVGVVHHVGGGLARRVRELLGLALVLVLQQARDEVLDLRGVDPHDALHAVVAPAVLLQDGNGGEGDVAAGQLLHLGDEVHDVPAVGQHHRALHGVLQPVERRRARQRLARDDLVGKRGHHGLLARHPVEVAPRQVVALPDEAQRLRAVQLLRAGGEVGARERFVDGVLEADVDAAEGVGDQREAEQADLGVVVDGDAGQVGDGLDQRLAARLRSPSARRRRGPRPAASTSSFIFSSLTWPKTPLIFVLPRSRRLDVGVARDRDRGRRLPVVRDADQDDRVGVGRDVVAGAQRGEFVGRQRVAVRVGPAVHADEQDVDGAVLAAAAERRGASRG